MSDTVELIRRTIDLADQLRTLAAQPRPSRWALRRVRRKAARLTADVAALPSAGKEPQ